MTRAIVPIAQMQRRLQESGRIRTGVKSGNAMKAIPTFRFTSGDRSALEAVAEQYGGIVKPWSDPKAAKGQHEVITEAPEISVVLPPDPLGDSPFYELYSGGGVERRCDGVTCQVVQQGPDGPEPADVACLCVAKDAMACKPTLHLSVILPNVRFTGVWRLTTHSWNALAEMPGMVDLIQSQQATGLTRGVLSIVPERSVYGGKTKVYQVVRLGVDHTVEELAAGAAQLGALPASDTPALPERPALTAAPDPDDDVVDAELVNEGDRPVPTFPQRRELVEALACLEGDQRDHVKTWWKDEHLPKPEKLSSQQVERVLAYLDGCPA